jgi:hypothetical protein
MPTIKPDPEAPGELAACLVNLLAETRTSRDADFCFRGLRIAIIYNSRLAALASHCHHSVNKGGSMMSVMEHLDSLKAKHQDLEHLIEEEEARPRPDEDKIHELKRQKLRIKDEIAGHDHH